MKQYYGLILFLFLLFFFCQLTLDDEFMIVENYENIYEVNETIPDEPDDKQFYPCRHEKFTDDSDYPFEEYPNSNYRVKVNQVKKPQKGTFSAFIDTNKIRTYDHFFHAPICEDSYDFDTDINSQFRSIPGASPEEDINVLLSIESDKDDHDLRNPYFFHGNPKYIQNTILYEDEIQDMFLKVKLNMPLRHEDDQHLVNDHQYEGTHE